MVGTLVRLQFKLFGRSVAGNAAKIVGLVLGGLWLLSMVVAASIGLVVLRSHSVALTGVITVAAFGAITLMWPFVTLLVAGADQTLDPGRFALLPVRARQLQPGLFVVDLLGLGGIATCLVSLAYAVAWSKSAPMALAALVGGALGTATCVLLSRCLVSLFSDAIASRRYRDVAAIILALVGMTSGISAQVITRAVQASPGQISGRLHLAAQIVSWTPFGWSWALPWRVGAGDWAGTVVRLVLAAALLAGLWAMWGRALGRALISPLESGGSGEKVSAHGLADRIMPRTVAGAIGARSLRYWRRDPRHIVQFVAVLALPFVMVAPMLMQPETRNMPPGVLLFYPVGAVLLMGAMVVANEINYDGSALWMQVTSGVTGRDDRWGRLLAVFVVLGPVIVVIDAAFAVISGSPRYLPAMIGATIGSFLSACAVGTVVGALWQYAVPPPGQNAFARTSGGGTTGMIAALVNMGASLALAIPVLVPAILSQWIPWLGWLSLGIALVGGPLLVWGAVVMGGRRLERAWPEVLGRVTYEKS